MKKKNSLYEDYYGKYTRIYISVILAKTLNKFSEYCAKYSR